MEDFYRVLGVGKTATPAEIKKAYRMLVKRYHPDLHPGDAEAERHFKRITAAYEVLSDETRKAAYDSARHSGSAQKEAAKKQGTSPKTTFDPRDPGFNFESFFGFDPETKEVTDQDKLSGQRNKKGALSEELFAKMMGIK